VAHSQAGHGKKTCGSTLPTHRYFMTSCISGKVAGITRPLKLPGHY